MVLLKYGSCEAEPKKSKIMLMRLCPTIQLLIRAKRGFFLKYADKDIYYQSSFCRA